MSINGYSPKAIVEYDRMAFVAKENKTRVTFDRSVRATETNFDLFDASFAAVSRVRPVQRHP